MAQFKLTYKHFFAPDMLPEGTVIELPDDSDPNKLTPMMEPLDDAAIVLMEKYKDTHPRATINPVADLPLAFNIVAPKPEAARAVKIGGN